MVKASRRSRPAFCPTPARVPPPTMNAPGKPLRPGTEQSRQPIGCHSRRGCCFLCSRRPREVVMKKKTGGSSSWYRWLYRKTDSQCVCCRKDYLVYCTTATRSSSYSIAMCNN
ncbi:uncharacterized protein LOC144057501 isoform X2 [Vanacampus margaritifer]